MEFNPNDKNQSNTFFEMREKNQMYENFTGAIFGAGILIISVIVLLCMGWKL